MSERVAIVAKAGDRFRVKRTPWNNQYGIRCGGRWRAAADDRVWPGEIGTVAERKWTTVDGHEMSDLWLEFERGRDLLVSHTDVLDFVKVSKNRQAPVDFL